MERPAAPPARLHFPRTISEDEPQEPKRCPCRQQRQGLLVDPSLAKQLPSLARPGIHRCHYGRPQLLRRHFQHAQPPSRAAQLLRVPRAHEALAKAAPHGTAAAHAGSVSSTTAVARNDTDEFQAAPGTGVASRATGPQATPGAVGGMGNALVPEVRPQRSFAESEAAQAVQRAAPLAFGKTQAGMHSVSAARPQWRIGPDGHLERSMAAGQWTRVLDEQPTTFHAVAVMGNDVWAGGNGGALFHSSNGGEHWSKVSLAANSNVETGAIVSIRFEDPQHGIVACDSGTRWATADGGVTWITH